MGLLRNVLASALILAAASTVALGETVLHRGNGTEPETLDIHKSSGVPEYYLQLDLFEGLLTPSAAGEPIPGAAESWTVTDDGLTYTFTLRPDGTWSDGAPVTAHDFVFAWRRLVDPATASDYAYFLWPVAGAEAISKGEDKDLSRLGVEAVDDRTLRVTLRAPTPYFLAALTHHSTFPLPQAAVEKHGAEWVKPGRLVGNGAYVLAEHVPQSHLKLVRNPHFHDAANVRIDTVYFYPTEDKDAELKRYRAGELDVTYEVPNQQIPWIEQNLKGQFHVSPYFGTYFYAFNLTREPWRSNAMLRQALALAIDRDILVGKILQSGQVPAYSFVPPGTQGYQVQAPEYGRMTQAERDALARRLLADAGYGPGGKPLEVEILYNTSENHKKLAVAVAAMWKQKLGIATTLNNQEWKVYLGTRSGRQFKDIVRHGWIGDVNDANNFLELLRGDIGDQNPTGYANPEYDDLLRQAARTRDPAARVRLLEQAERLMLADQPIIPVYFYSTRHLVAAHVKGWQDNIQDLHPTRFLSVER